ncbi:MAG TPA: enoyl-CoA hydratase/isomerase family protein [Bacteroidia bacterium]|nr:enoyl-CoA hydratase/isomerase family protein [Bacteroidia bacterium]
MDAFVRTEIQSGVATICFFHPQSNSMPGEQLRNLAAEIEKQGKNEEVKVIVLKSEGEKAFCAGASFDELIRIKDLESGIRFFSGFAMVINAMRKAPKFILARVQGKAVGGGVGIACSADYTFATEAASVKLSELAVGIGPFVVGPAVERKIGSSAFCQLTIDASEWQSAHWAREKGLYNQVFTNIAEMDRAISALVSKLSASNPEAMRLLKQVMWKGTENWDDLLLERAGMSGKLVLSEFTIKAIQAFKQKT